MQYHEFTLETLGIVPGHNPNWEDVNRQMLKLKQEATIAGNRLRLVLSGDYIALYEVPATRTIVSLSDEVIVRDNDQKVRWLKARFSFTPEYDGYDCTMLVNGKRPRWSYHHRARKYKRKLERSNRKRGYRFVRINTYHGEVRVMTSNMKFYLGKMIKYSMAEKGLQHKLITVTAREYIEYTETTGRLHRKGTPRSPLAKTK